MLDGYEYSSFPAMGFREGEEYVQEGLAIFSRYPILHIEVLQLSRDANDGEDFHQRIALIATIHTPIGIIHCINTHLSLSAQARKRTLMEIAKQTKQVAQRMPAMCMYVSGYLCICLICSMCAV